MGSFKAGYVLWVCVGSHGDAGMGSQIIAFGSRPYYIHLSAAGGAGFRLINIYSLNVLAIAFRAGSVPFLCRAARHWHLELIFAFMAFILPYQWVNRARGYIQSRHSTSLVSLSGSGGSNEAWRLLHICIHFGNFIPF